MAKKRPLRPNSQINEKTTQCPKNLLKEGVPTVAGTLKLLEILCPQLGKWLSLNLAILTAALLQLWQGARSGQGHLTLCALSRAMPLLTPEKVRSKRLYRLLRNRALEGPQMTPLLVRLALGEKPKGFVPIVIDQTDIRGTPTLLAGILVAHRVLPVAFACFRYETLYKSQNRLESALLKLVAASLPPGCKPLYVMDRGYARVSLLKELSLLRIPYLIRGRSHTIVRSAGQRLSLGRLPHAKGRAIRYSDVAYHDQQQEHLDVLIFHDPDFKEPWYLLVPPHSQALLPDEAIVALYRQRMHIELTFRDWKTHLGIRGLSLQVDIAPRLERLIFGLTLAYILALLIGAGKSAPLVRRHCEVLRCTPRHGTRRRLSALSVGILLLSLPQFRSLARSALRALLKDLRHGVPSLILATHPP